MSFSVRQRGHILRATDAALLSMITVNSAHSGSKSVKRQSANTPYAGKSIDTHVIRHGSRLEASDQLPMEDKAGSDPQLTYHFPIVISHSNFQKFERNIVLRTGLWTRLQALSSLLTTAYYISTYLAARLIHIHLPQPNVSLLPSHRPEYPPPPSRSTSSSDSSGTPPAPPETHSHPPPSTQPPP